MKDKRFKYFYVTSEIAFFSDNLDLNPSNGRDVDIYVRDGKIYSYFCSVEFGG